MSINPPGEYRDSRPIRQLKELGPRQSPQKQRKIGPACILYFLVFYLFTCDLFSDAVSKPDYVATSDRMMNNIGYRYYLCFDFRIIYNNTESPLMMLDFDVFCTA